jgi:hypothetical protein
MRQLTLRERGGRATIGLPLDELAMMRSRNKLAAYGKTVRDATAFYLDHLERIQRCNVTVEELVCGYLVRARMSISLSGTLIRAMSSARACTLGAIICPSALGPLQRYLVEAFTEGLRTL